MHLLINCSGGKDSIAMLAWICENYPDVPKTVIFADTGWEHPDAEEWTRNMTARFGLELQVTRSSTKTFLSMSEKRGMFPGMQTRQCTSDLKQGPIMTWMRRNIQDTTIINCLGFRSEESAGRSKVPRLVRNKRETNSKRTVWNWCPIKDWTEAQVLQYLAERDLPLHPVYQYLRRFSCRMCIFMTDHDVLQVSKNDPEAIQIISDLEEKIGFTFFQRGSVKQILSSKSPS